MAQDLTPKVIDVQDVDTYDRDSGRVKRITQITYRLGEFGPFREEFERDQFTETELRLRMSRRADTIKPFS